MPAVWSPGRWMAIPRRSVPFFLDCVEQEEQSFIELVEGLRRGQDPDHSIHNKADLADRFGESLRARLAQNSARDVHAVSETHECRPTL